MQGGTLPHIGLPLPFSSRWFQWAAGLVTFLSKMLKSPSRNLVALPRTEQSFNYVTRIVPCTTKASTGNQYSRKCFTLLRFFLQRTKEKRRFGLSTHPLPAIAKDVTKWGKFMIPEVPRIVWFLDIKRLLQCKNKYAEEKPFEKLTESRKFNAVFWS